MSSRRRNGRGGVRRADGYSKPGLHEVDVLEGRKEVMIYAALGKQADFEIGISLSVPVLVDMYMCRVVFMSVEFCMVHRCSFNSDQFIRYQITPVFIMQPPKICAEQMYKK
jgi:hypothetical protein